MIMSENATQNIQRLLSGHIFAFITCTRVMWPEGSEDPIEEHGWIDRRWSTTTLYDNRNDVGPVVDVDLSDTETLGEEVRDALGWLEGGYNDNGDGTFYAADSYQPYEEPWNYSYALHFVRKFYGPKGWTEEAWTPPADMLIEPV
jgi:hypothetical protein